MALVAIGIFTLCPLGILAALAAKVLAERQS